MIFPSYPSRSLVQARRTCGMRAQNGMREDLLGSRNSLLSQIFISFARPTSQYCEEYVYVSTHLSDCVETVYELPLLPNNTVSGTFLHKLGAARSADGILTIAGTAWR